MEWMTAGDGEATLALGGADFRLPGICCPEEVVLAEPKKLPVLETRTPVAALLGL